MNIVKIIRKAVSSNNTRSTIYGYIMYECDCSYVTSRELLMSWIYSANNDTLNAILLRAKSKE